MPNMSLKKNEMPTQAPEVRNSNFLEVALGYTEEQAIDEAKRCLNCKHKPCTAGCPVKIHISDFIAQVAEGNFEEAYRIISQSLYQLFAAEYVLRRRSVRRCACAA